MPKLTLNNIASGFATNSALNANFDTIETAMENTLSRDGSTPNHMLSSLDMNSHSIHNLGRATTLSSAISLGQFFEYANTEENLSGVVPITWEFLSTGASSYQLALASTNKVDMYIVSVDGLIYSPTEYIVDVDSQTIFFNTVPAVGTDIVVRLFGKIPEATNTSVTIQNIRQSYVFSIVTNETVFITPVELIENTDVFLNGVKLIYTTDYTVSGTNVILNSPGSVGDILEVITYSAIVVASEIITGDITLSGDGHVITGNITGDPAQSLSFKHDTDSEETNVFIVGPGPTVPAAYLSLWGDTENTHTLSLGIDATSARLASSATGTGTTRPLTFHTSGSEKLRIAADTTGTYTFGGTAPRITGDFGNTTHNNRLLFQTSTVNGNTALGVIPNGTGTYTNFNAWGNSDCTNASYAQLLCGPTDARITSAYVGTGTYLPMTFYTGGSERLRIDTSGNVLATSPTGLGYGTGAGGEVVQGTSRTTGVTLSKPTGKITLFSKAATAGLVDSFTVTNTLVAATDVIQLSMQSGTVDATDIYIPVVSQVSAGSFRISIYTPAATATEAPVINFAVIKGVIA